MSVLQKNNTVIAALLVGTITFLLYLPALTCEFVNFDDPEYIYENLAIRVLDWQFVLDAFSTSYKGWWMPLTWLSLAVDYHFWGLNPFGYHLTNILLHAANAGVAVLVADRLYSGWQGSPDTKPGSPAYSVMLLLAGLFWSLHPLRVESVAWVTERKDVLNGLFSLAAIYCYLRYVLIRSVQSERPGGVRAYFFSLCFFLLSLMAKPVSVVLPIMLLVLDWYPLGRLSRGNVRLIVKEKIPYLLLALMMSIATIRFAAGETILVPFSELTLDSRFLVAGHALVEYVRMIIWPSNLVHLYLMPRLFPLSFYLYAALAIVFTFCSIRNRYCYPALLACWLLFILPLLPVLGFLQSGAQSHADRFTYLPSLLPTVIAVYVVAAALQRYSGSLPGFSAVFITVSAFIVLLGYAVLSVHLIGFWRNSETLWSRLIAVQPVGRAYYYRGDHLLQQGRYAEAAADFRESIRMGYDAGHPEIYKLHAIRGEALRRGGRFEESLQEFTAALNLEPQSESYYNRSLALRALGRGGEADEDLRQARSLGFKALP